MTTQNIVHSDTRPTLETARLILRPFRLEDARTVQLLAGDKEVTSRMGRERFLILTLMVWLKLGFKLIPPILPRG